MLHYPMCAELLMQIFEKFDLHVVWAAERSRMFKQYMENHDSVKLLTYFAKFINFWFKRYGSAFKTKENLPELGPLQFPITIMSPDGNTDWTRMAWMIKNITHDERDFTLDYMSKAEDRMKTQSLMPDFASKRRSMWEKEQKTDVKIANDLASVARRLENSEQTKVSFTMWKEKLGAFCTSHQKQKFVSAFYTHVIGMILQVNRYVNYKRLEKQRINELIKQINEAVDDNNTKFRDRDLSKFTFRNHEENIMDTLEHLPDELRETSPRSRSPSRSRVGGYRSTNMSELLLALQALL